MFKSKGFTLIELLAVIVILAVIATIATPIITSIIESSKKSSIESSARNIMRTSLTYYVTELQEDNVPTIVDLESDKLEYSGTQATKGYIKYDEEGLASGKMYINGYCIDIAKNGKLTSEKKEENECDTEIKVVSGVAYYFNPETNTSCTLEEKNANTSKNTGCLKWYSFLDDDSTTVRLILDHNTTAQTTYSTNNASEDTKLSGQLQEDIKTWHSDVKSKTRIISANEIAEITGNKTWTASGTPYYFHTGTATKYKGAIGTNKYAWLFDYTTECDEVGCNYVDDSTQGYWTSTSGTGNNFWAIRKSGVLTTAAYHEGLMYGIRPVITIKKSLLS